MTDYQALRARLGRTRSTIRPGESVQGVVTRLVLERSPYPDEDERARLYLTDPVATIWVNGPLFDVLEAMNVQDGERLSISRGDDMPGVGGRHGRSTWVVERLNGQQPAPPPQPQYLAGTADRPKEWPTW